MMCHSSLLVQHLLTDPTKPRSSVRPSRITAHIASLKWTRPAYSKKLSATMGKDVNYDKSPSEDFASVVIEFETDDGHRVLGEATTSWSFVGAGLRVFAELEFARLRPEALFQPRGSGQSGRGPGREAERRNGADAGRRR
jgi:hypothetical protein